MAFSAEQMFRLVNDVSEYPKFVPGCVGSEVIEQSDTSMIARLDLSKAGMKQSFTTKNTLSFPHRISLLLEEGPFKFFAGEWRFDALAEDACKVTFCLEFEFSNIVLTNTIGKIFEKVASEQVNAMCDRAKLIY